MTDVIEPAPGWYPDPEEPARYRRYWDGQRWTVRQLLPQASPVPRVPGLQPADPRQPLGAGFRALGQVVGTGLVLVALLVGAQLVPHGWGVRMIDGAVATGDLERLDRYDNLNRLSSAVFLQALAVVGTCWMVWQYRLARDVGPNAVRRTPPWHAWAWVIPIEPVAAVPERA